MKSRYHLVLASSSPYRQRLLRRLGLDFSAVAANIDESPRDAEDARALANRLSREKAEAVASEHPGVLVLGSDQVATINGQLLGKPGGRERALEQLSACSGHSVRFETGVALVRDGRLLGARCVTTEVMFRSLSQEELAFYVDQDRPWDCAGSFRWEALGIALFSALRSDDPTALEGLPLIATIDLLRENGVNPLNSKH